ncbi:MAG: DNRLRE domain-containing protein [Candidatus Bathyarchaeia archaeon]
MNNLEILGRTKFSTITLRILIPILITVILTSPPINVWAVESTLTIQPSTADTFVNSMYLSHKYPEEPHGYLWGIFAGNMYTEYDSFRGYGSSRIYIQFNISSIPKDAKILSANMCLYMYDSPKTSQEFEAHRILSDWNEHELTWITQPAYVQKPTSTVTVNPTPGVGWICWDITSDLQLWHSGAARNFGTMIKIRHERNATDQVASFYPKEALQAQHLKPKLTVRIDWYKSIPTQQLQTPTPTETPRYTPSQSETSPTLTPIETPKDSTGHESKGDGNNATLIIASVLTVGVILILLRRPSRDPRKYVGGRHGLSRCRRKV